MLQLIKKLLNQIIDDIDAGNSNVSYEEQCKILHFIQNITDKDQRMSKIQACDYLGVSRATFDNYVKNGWIPKGYKQDGFKELSWMKSDLTFIQILILIISNVLMFEETQLEVIIN